jgi:succinate dehydrogenase/fumarate reductase-like Fe-S protein
MAYVLTVIGKPHTMDADGDTPLPWVLRDMLQMTGTKFGCGMALCGACTVHLEGAATRACITPIDSVRSPSDHRGGYCGPGMRKHWSVSAMRNGFPTCPNLISAPQE